MEDVNAEYIERYQKLFEKDPKSRVFAPLAEGYRKMGLIKEGIEVAEAGVRIHPLFAGGRVALGRLYIANQQLDKAEMEFRRAAEAAPENLLAHQLLAETQLKLKKPKDALKTYKMLLYLSPDNEKAKVAVQKLESLTADEYSDDFFAMKPLKEAVKGWSDFDLDFEGTIKPSAAGPQLAKSVRLGEQATPIKPKADQEPGRKFLDRILSLVDAYMVRQDMDRAIEALNEGERLIGPHPEIVKRLKIVHQRQLERLPHPKSAQDLKMTEAKPSRGLSPVDKQIEYLQDLLQKIKQRSR